ncbi:MAG: metal-dependent hydrolase [Planctomycetia bacterium]
MDPLTQGLLGAVAAQAALPARHARAAWAGGLAGGLLPDADVLLGPWSDPALPWELHRHFTHGLLLAPVLGLLAAGLLLLLVPPLRAARRAVAAAAVLGALTHAPLDLCTSYGTKALWPFSRADLTWDLYPIIDPLFTLLLLLGVVLAAVRGRRRPAVLALAGVALYSGAALLQRSAALEAQATLARLRGHAPVRARVLPLPCSLLAWRSLYEVQGEAVADLLRITPWGGVQWVEGGRLPLLPAGQEAEGVATPAGRARVLDVARRYRTFADGWVARLPGEPLALGDLRFSLDPAFRPPWALRLAASPDEPPVRWESRPLVEGDGWRLLALLAGSDPALRPLPGTP